MEHRQRLTILFIAVVAIIAVSSGVKAAGFDFQILAVEKTSSVDAVQDIPLSPSFADVPEDHWAYSYIEALFSEGYIEGCEVDPERKFCPEEILTRAQAAVLIERGLHPSIPNYMPPAPTEQKYVDVLVGEAEAWSAKWINKLADDEITAGCSTDPPKYCPDQMNARVQMTVFVERVLHGAEYRPPEADRQLFNDVPLIDAQGNPNWMVRWVNGATDDGLIQACQTDMQAMNFDPDRPITRAEAACMLYHAVKVEKAAAPTFQIEGVSEDGYTLVLLNTSTSGATIRYTFDGTTPGPSSAIYQEDTTLTVWPDAALKARSFKDGMAGSDTAFIESPDASELPDLVAYELNVSPASPEVGEVVNFTGSIRNGGAADAGASGVIYCMNSSVEDCYRNEAGKFGAVYNTGEVLSGESASGFPTYWTPTDPGEYLVHICVNPGGRILESVASADSNCHSVTFEVEDTGKIPDLTVTALDWPTTAQPGEDILLASVARNEGTGVANDGYLVQFFVDGQAVPNEGDQIGSWKGSMMVPDGQESHGFLWTAVCGIHAFEVKVDTDDTIVESVETNNSTGAKEINVDCTSGDPDKVDVILITYEGYEESMTPSDFEELYFNSENSVANFYEEVSYGASSLHGNVYGWYELPSTVTDCETARRMAAEKAQIDGATFVEGQRVSYVFGSELHICTRYAGQASIGPWPGPGMDVNVNWSYITIPDFFVIAHELGHNYRVGHAGSKQCPNNTYIANMDCKDRDRDNYLDIMGNDVGHMNAALKEHLGWLSPRVISEPGRHHLEPLESSPDALKVDWFYVEYRREERVMAINLSEPLQSKLIFIGSEGETFIDEGSNIQIRMENATDSGADIVVSSPPLTRPEFKIIHSELIPYERYYSGDLVNATLKVIAVNLSKLGVAEDVTLTVEASNGLIVDPLQVQYFGPHGEGQHAAFIVEEVAFTFPDYGLEIKAIVDPENAVPEMNDANNELTLFIPEARHHAPSDVSAERELAGSPTGKERIRIRWQDNSDRETGHVLYMASGEKPDDPFSGIITRDYYDIEGSCGESVSVWVEAAFKNHLWFYYSDPAMTSLTFCEPPAPILPDLVAYELIVSPESPEVGDVVSFNSSIRNIGDADAGPSGVIYCMNSSVEDCYGTESGKFGVVYNTGEVPAGESSSGFPTYWTPTEAGEYLVHICINPGVRILESDKSAESNCHSLTFNVADTGKIPDLTVTTLDWPATAQPEEKVVLFYQVRNEGTGVVNGGYLVQFYVDGQAVPNEGDQIGSRRPVAMIVPGGVDSNGFIWTGSCGVHTVEVKVDVENTVGESNEINNSTGVHTITVACP